MKNSTIFLCLLLCAASAFAQAPTVPASSVTFNFIEGNTLRVNWTNGNGARRIVIARQGSAVTATPVNGVDYNHNAAFGLGDAVQPGQFVVADGAANFADVSGLQPATTYHFAVYEYNGTGAATQYIATAATGNSATLSAPSVQASGLLFSNITGNSLRLDFTAGNGGNRLVVARQGSAVNANPVDLTVYGPSTIFGSGSQIGAGNFVVARGTPTNVTVTGLLPNTVYHFAVFELNGISGPVYLAPGATGNVTTAPRPTVATSAVSFNFLEGNTFRINWTNGNGARRIVVARQGSAVTAVPVDGVDYNHNNTFGLGDAIQPGEFVVSDGTTNFADISGLAAATTYHFRIYEYDGTGAGTAYLTSSFATASQATLSSPATQASGLNFTNLSGSSVTLNWTNGSGTSRIVLARAGSAVNSDPVNLTSYVPNSIFGSGSQIGTGNFVLFRSTGSSPLIVTGLSINTTYHFAVYEFNGSSGPVYLTPAATANVTTPAQPTVPSSALLFNFIEGNTFRINWTSGNGARRIVVGRAGSAVSAVPTDGVDYTANASFGSGAAIQPGEFVLYNNTGNFVDISGLSPATTYHFRIYEFNGTGASTAYLTASFGSGNQATLSAPTTQASAVNFTNVSGSTVRINWTNGNGVNRIVLLRQGSAVNADPVNLTVYSPSTVFGSGSQIGTGNFVVFRGSSPANVTVTNLLPNTVYHAAVYELNGTSGPVYALPGAVANVTTGAQPTVAPTNMFFTFIEGNTMRVSWTNGNGGRRIVVGRAGSAVTATPTNGVNYTPSANFGSGDALAPGQFVVFDGTGFLVDLTNLLPNTVYHFAVFEYDGSGTTTGYLLTSLTGNQSTVSAPTIQASNVSFSAVAGTSVTVGWTAGNGGNRIVVARQGSAVNSDPVDLVNYGGSSVFGSGTQIGSGNFAITNTSATSVGVTGLTSGTTYHFAVYEFNGGNGKVYLRPGAVGNVTTPGAPQTQATNAATGTITTTTMQLTWTNGSGNRRLVLMKQGTAVDATPVNNTVYTANSAFGSGTQLGSGNFVVFNGVGNSVLVTNISSNTTYHFAVFEFNDFGATSQFLLTNPARGSGTTPIALPVNFIEFSAKNNGNNILLQWSTAQEQNSSHFEIEKSSDGRSFVEAGRVSAAGNSATRKDYLFADERPFAGNSYYRLRQVDADGKFLYSTVVHVKYEAQHLIKRMTNPVRQQLKVELNGYRPGSDNQWLLYDLQGRIVASDRISGDVIEKNLSSLVAGMYLLEVKTDGKAERVKFIKQ